MALARAAAFKRTVLRGSASSLFAGSSPSVFARAMGSKAIVPDMVRKGKAVAAEPQDLLSVLSREISYEKEDATSAETLKDIAASIPDFSVVDSKGQARFFLTRKFQNTEIRVDLDCSPVPADDDEGFDEDAEADEAEEEDQAVTEGYRMLISIKDASKGKEMQLGAFITDHLRVHRVTMYDIGKAPSSDQVFGGFDELPVYSGPAFDELDDALQNAFYDFLAERGIDDDFAGKLTDYCANKEQVSRVQSGSAGSSHDEVGPCALTADGSFLYVGKDKFENEDLIKHGWPEDIWFHVDNISSPHVYVRLGPYMQGKTMDDLTDEVIRDAAQWCKEGSIDGCKKKTVNVIYTPWSNLRKDAGMAPGQVGFHNDRMVRKYVVLEKDRETLRRLEKTREERYPDLAAERRTRDEEEKRALKAESRERSKKEKELDDARKKEKEERSYDRLFKKPADGKGDAKGGAGDDDVSALVAAVATVDVSAARAFEDDFM